MAWSRYLYLITPHQITLGARLAMSGLQATLVGGRRSSPSYCTWARPPLIKDHTGAMELLRKPYISF